MTSLTQLFTWPGGIISESLQFQSSKTFQIQPQKGDPPHVRYQLPDLKEGGGGEQGQGQGEAEKEEDNGQEAGVKKEPREAAMRMPMWVGRQAPGEGNTGSFSISEGRF